MRPPARSMQSGSVSRFATLWCGIALMLSCKAASLTAQEKGKNVTDKELRLFLGHKGPVHFVAFMPDGKQAFSTGADKTVRLWDVATGKEVRRLEELETILYNDRGRASLIFSPDGTRALIAESTGEIRLWDVETWKELRRFKVAQGKKAQGSPALLSFSPDGRRIHCGAADGIRIWDAASGKEEFHFKQAGSARAFAISPDKKRLMAGYDNRSMVFLWDLENNVKLRQTQLQNAAPYRLAYAADGKEVLAFDHRGGSWALDAETGKELRELTKPFHGGHSCFTATADGRHALIGTGPGIRFILYDVESEKELHSFTGHTNSIVSIASSADGRYLLSASDDKTLRLWQVPDSIKLAPWPKAGRIRVGS